MRFVFFFLVAFLFLGFVKAQWDDDDDDPRWPDDPDDEDPDDDDPPRWTTTTRRQPTPTRRPTSTRGPTRRPTSTRGPTRPTSTTVPDPEESEPPVPTPTGIDTFANATLYQPDDSSHHLTSPRTENLLVNNTILAVWNDPEQANDTLSVYRSTNDGFSWYAHGTARSTVAGRRLLEPHLLYVEGTWSSETNMTLLAVNAVDAKSTNIELYASWDNGVTFEFVHRVAEGGSTAETRAVGQPFLLLHDKRLTVYYVDQRDGQHAQKIVHQSTADMWENWGTAIDVAASNTLSEREGMTSVAKLPNNQYIIVFESQAGNGSTVSSTINYKLTSTPENVGTELKREITTSTSAKPKGAAYVAWSPVGGTNGTIVLSDSTSNSVFVNQALGAGPWREVVTGAGRAFAREVRAVPNDKTKLRIAGGSENAEKSSDVLVTVIDLEKALAAK